MSRVLWYTQNSVNARDPQHSLCFGESVLGSSNHVLRGALRIGVGGTLPARVNMNQASKSLLKGKPLLHQIDVFQFKPLDGLGIAGVSSLIQDGPHPSMDLRELLRIKQL